MHQKLNSTSEGWSGGLFYSMFDAADCQAVTDAYGVSSALPGYRVIGLLGWDDFLLSKGDDYFTCPTVPVELDHVRPLSGGLPDTLEGLSSCPGRIKWYVTPLVFGGDANDEANIQWIDYSQHQQLVRWWNAKYIEAKS